MKKLKYLYYDLVHGIKNLIKWFKIIWIDRDWDHAYIDYILLFKLKETYKILKNGHAAPLPSNPEYWQGVKALKICIILLDRKDKSFYSYWAYNRKLKIKDNDSYKISNKMEERDWKIFCKLFETYHDYWWD